MGISDSGTLSNPRWVIDTRWSTPSHRIQNLQGDGAHHHLRPQLLKSL